MLPLTLLWFKVVIECDSLNVSVNSTPKNEILVKNLKIW